MTLIPIFYLLPFFCTIPGKMDQFFATCDVTVTSLVQPSTPNFVPSCTTRQVLQLEPCPSLTSFVAQKLCPKMSFWHFSRLVHHVLGQISWHRDVVPQVATYANDSQLNLLPNGPIAISVPITVFLPPPSKK